TFSLKAPGSRCLRGTIRAENLTLQLRCDRPQFAMDVQVRPPDFISTLEHMSKLKDYLLHLHESEVAQHRDESSRLRKDVITLRALVKKNFDDRTIEHTASDPLGSTWTCDSGALDVERVLTEPVVLD
ncbi:unnamed protein product, partial [Prorocentrum cordatum]